MAYILTLKLKWKDPNDLRESVVFVVLIELMIGGQNPKRDLSTDVDRCLTVLRIQL